MKQALDNGRQSFAFTAPEAVSVQLVGDFTHWLQSPVNLKKGAKGVWQTRVSLTPGIYRYRFLVDGQWSDAPDCVLRVANPFGGGNRARKTKEDLK